MMVRVGIGVMLLPAFTISTDAPERQSLVYVPLDQGPVIHLSLVRRRDRPLLRAAEIVWQMIADSAAMRAGPDMS